MIYNVHNKYIPYIYNNVIVYFKYREIYHLLRNISYIT